MIPSRLLLWLVGGLMLLGFAAGWWPESVLPTLWQALTGSLALVALFDAWYWRHAPQVRIERQTPSVWPVAKWQSVQLTLHNEDTRPLHLQVIDAYPTEWDMEDLPHASHIMPGNYVRFAYRLRPPKRVNAR